MSDKWDVVIAGAGPGGNIAANVCAKHGLKTLLIEKKPLPRDKVCSGMVMGDWAQQILTSEFGNIPNSVLVPPQYLEGYAVHVPETPVQTLDLETPITWRKHLDHWMSQKAQDNGAVVWDGARIVNVNVTDGKYSVSFRKDGKETAVESEFIIGADGARSVVRSSLFPELKPVYWHCYRECYDSKLDLPEKRFNFFSTIQTAPFYFCTHDKDGFMLLEGGAEVGTIKQTAAQSKQFLIDHHQMDPAIQPAWKDGCVEPILYRELFSGEFRPAKNKALIVGDAAGLNMPVTGEGVGTSLKSGLDAAHAIIKAKQSGIDVAATYLETIDEFIVKFQDIYAFSRRIKAAAATKEPKSLSDALLESWDYALKLF